MIKSLIVLMCDDQVTYLFFRVFLLLIKSYLWKIR